MIITPIFTHLKIPNLHDTRSDRVTITNLAPQAQSRQPNYVNFLFQVEDGSSELKQIHVPEEKVVKLQTASQPQKSQPDSI